MYKTHNSPNVNYRPQSYSSDNICIPNQACALRYMIMDALNGAKVNTIPMQYDGDDVAIDSPDLRFMDYKHMTQAQVDTLFAPHPTPPIADPVGGQVETTENVPE